MSSPNTLEMAFHDRFRFLNSKPGNTSLYSTSNNMMGSTERGYKIGVHLQHQFNRFIIQEKSMFNRTNPCPKRILNSFRPLCMSGRPSPCLSCFLHTCDQFFQGKLGCTGVYSFRHDPSGCHQLNEVHASLELLSHCLTNLICAIGLPTELPSVASRHADQFAAADHPWSFKKS